MVAHAEFVLRIGGKMRTLYDPAGKLGDPATIENTIICYDPKRMLSIKVSKVPQGFPFPQAVKSMWTVIYFEAESTTKTRVKIVGLGFGDDDESKQMRAFFDRGNAQTLRQLQSYFALQTSGEKYMKPDSIMRVARPTDNLAAIAEMYAKGLGFTVLAQFHGHEGFDGVILGHPNQPYHIEFITQRGHQVGKAPTKDHLLVFYIPDQDEWEASCRHMRAAGFRRVSSYNSYWDVRGRTFEDLDAYRVVLQNASWTK